jgi:hypothetical protein
MVEAIKWHSYSLFTFRFSTSCIQLCCSSCYKLRIVWIKKCCTVVKFAAEFRRFISNICVFVCPNGPPCATATGEVIKLIAVSIALGNEEFLYIDREESILCLDQNRLYYLMIDEAEICHCKTTTNESYVCTQSHAVMCSDWQETGVVELL